MGIADREAALEALHEFHRLQTSASQYVLDDPPPRLQAAIDQWSRSLSRELWREYRCRKREEV